MKHYTYAHYRKSDDKLFYIGKGIGSRFKSSDPRNPFWLNTVKKHGFKAEILAHWSTAEEALEHEIFLISCFKKMNFSLCNMTEGGEGRKGVTNTLEIRTAHSHRMKNPNFNPSKRVEVRLKLSGENNPMFGKRGKNSPHYGKPREDQRVQLTCTHCEKTGMAAGMRRWHFDHCKFKVVK